MKMEGFRESDVANGGLHCVSVKHACLLDGCCCRNESIASPHACSVLSVKVATDRESLAVIRVSNIISDLQGFSKHAQASQLQDSVFFCLFVCILSPEIKNLLISGSWLRHTAVQSAVFIQTNNTHKYPQQTAQNKFTQISDIKTKIKIPKLKGERNLMHQNNSQLYCLQPRDH